MAALLGLAAAPVQGAPVKETRPPAKSGGEFPLHITAAKLEADQAAGVIIFSGNVKATYGDSILYADQLRVFFKPKPAAAKGKEMAPAAGAAKPAGASSPLGELGGDKLDHIVAQGSVRFVQGDRVATGQTATYYQDRDEVVLVGHPQLWQEENNLKGERIIFNLKDNKMRVEGSPHKRVEAHLYPAKQGARGKGVSPLPAKPKAPR
jgi:lipopolysaccharide export system protein LptA